MAASRRVLKNILWQPVVRFQGRTTLDECRRIIDRLEEFAALLTGRSSSPATEVYKLYARTRTPVWQLVRRSAASVRSIYRKDG